MEIFPSFKNEIQRLRIRYGFELEPLRRQDPKMYASVRDALLHSKRKDWITLMKAVEDYSFQKGGHYDFGNTIYTRFVHSYESNPKFHSGYVHEATHYLTELLLREAFGRAIHVKGHKRYVPLDVWEGLAVAFQHKYLEQYEDAPFDPYEYRLILKDLAHKYAHDYGSEVFEKERFLQTYWTTRKYIEKHGMDGAAKKIPKIVADVMKIEPRNPFKRR